MKQFHLSSRDFDSPWFNLCTIRCCRAIKKWLKKRKKMEAMPDGKWEHSVNMNRCRSLVLQNFHVFLLLLPNPDIPMQYSLNLFWTLQFKHTGTSFFSFSLFLFPAICLQITYYRISYKAPKSFSQPVHSMLFFSFSLALEDILCHYYACYDEDKAKYSSKEVRTNRWFLALFF